MSKIKTFYRRNLPHILPIGATFFITFRLYGSLPVAVLKKINDKYEEKIKKAYSDKEDFKQERLDAIELEYFEEFDDALHQIKTGPKWLRETNVAQILEKELKKYDGVFYKLITYCIMPNHVHILIDTSIQLSEDCDPDAEDFEYTQVDDIMRRIKGASAFRINRYLRRSGSFWESESYDSYMRSEKDVRKRVYYTIYNPVKAGLVLGWRDWPFTYVCFGKLSQ